MEERRPARPAAALSRGEPAYDLLLLAGGRATRLGGVDKPGLPLAGGESTLQRLLQACADARVAVVVGPRRPLVRAAGPLVWTRESPPGGGPLAAVAAGLPLTAAEFVVVLAADMPLAGRAVPSLLGALVDPGAEAAVLDAGGMRQPLAGAYRRPWLEERLAEVGDPAGRPARVLLGGPELAGRVTGVPDRWGAAADFDTWADRERIEEMLRDE